MAPQVFDGEDWVPAADGRGWGARGEFGDGGGGEGEEGVRGRPFCFGERPVSGSAWDDEKGSEEEEERIGGGNGGRGLKLNIA
ncbi:hypothetical protein H6P81_011182 [Aristolochia fimbriata]|uniref:Uncharacterized protein n=1 Tax=Aristolochia fimbriata TaxID=158543 RepID=A0AAV7EUA3_ARIFI|nr:hypothetical protein H6P81_011182 [Aristolochia fimbriata]